jgi:hypothetical protein
VKPYETGNAREDGEPYRGWLVGHFVNHHASLRRTEACEVKWGLHPAGEARNQWVTEERATTLVILISGRFHIQLSDDPTDEVVLSRQGDYATWGPGVDHHWEAEEDSVVLTVRWPSLPGRAGTTPDSGEQSVSG